MKVDNRSRWQYRIQSGVFVVLFLALLATVAWTSNRYVFKIDLSANQRNSLSTPTEQLLASLDSPLKITLFASPSNQTREALEALFERYRHSQSRISFQTLNPDLHPDLVRDHDIRFDGEVLLQYQQRSEKLSQITESSVTNAIQRLLRQGERWIVFIEGHGERNPYREANHDYSLFATQMASKGYTIENLNITQTSSIPDNTDVLVLASPKVPLLPGEITLLRTYIRQGGNFLWLADPEQAIDGIGLLADELGIEFLPGIVVDPNSQLMGLDRVDFAIVGAYPRHPVTQNLSSLSLFPESQALAFHADDQWQSQDFLRSDQRSWNETGKMRGEIFIGDDDDEQAGPLSLGITLTRDRPDGQNQQRVAVVGDADFLANSYLGNGSNLDIGLNLINWLSHDDNLIAINPRPAPDTRLDLSPTIQLAIAGLFLVLLPVSLIGGGLWIWLRRRKR